jgi:tRNA threonylcarbamoyladenosine biosynthesis protein TsaE
MHIATKSSKIDISLEVDTANLAKKFSKILKKGDIIFLYGEIGVGKTAFARYLINSFEKKSKISLSEVISPTFNIVNEYNINELNINHYDLFRLKSLEEVKNIGLLENTEDAITLVEWPEIIEEKNKNTINLKFQYEDNSEKRFIIIEGLNENILNEFK